MVSIIFASLFKKRPSSRDSGIVSDIIFLSIRVTQDSRGITLRLSVHNQSDRTDYYCELDTHDNAAFYRLIIESTSRSHSHKN